MHMTACTDEWRSVYTMYITACTDKWRSVYCMYMTACKDAWRPVYSMYMTACTDHKNCLHQHSVCETDMRALCNLEPLWCYTVKFGLVQSSIKDLWLPHTHIVPLYFVYDLKCIYIHILHNMPHRSCNTIENTGIYINIYIYIYI
jgi:hypothetical protein